jgi:hypothetical protein
MSRSMTPDFAALQVPQDQWSAPFWSWGAQRETRMPACTTCGTFRWPAGPFCPKCRHQEVEWKPAGQARIYTFTILPVHGSHPDTAPQSRIATLVEFEDAPGVRLVSALVDAEPGLVTIGMPVSVDWMPAADAVVPVFRMGPVA